MINDRLLRYPSVSLIRSASACLPLALSLLIYLKNNVQRISIHKIMIKEMIDNELKRNERIMVAY